MNLRRTLVLVLIAALIAPAPASAISVAEEDKIGQQINIQLRRHLKFVSDPLILNYLNRLGNKVVGLIPQNPFKYRLFIINHDQVNAFATPGGYVYLLRGLIETAENEAELMSVLCHEIAHAALRHISDRMRKAKRVSLATLAGLLAGVLLGVAAGGQAAGQISQALMAGSLAAGASAMLSYSRQDEAEADNQGYKYLTTLGYNPRDMISMLKRIRQAGLGMGDLIPSYLKTHPGTDDRILQIQMLMQRSPFRRRSSYSTGLFPLIKTRLAALYAPVDKAKTEFQRSVAKRPRDKLARYGLALVLRRLGRTREALALFRQLIRSDPDNLIYVRGVAVTYYQAGKMAQAREGLTRVLISHPNDVQALYYLGRAYQESDDVDAAYGVFRRLIGIAPNLPDVQYNYGLVLGRKGMEGLARYHLGLAARMRGRLKDALYHFKVAQRYLKKRPDLLAKIKDEVKGIKKIQKDMRRDDGRL
ncbi:MAG: M48 family metalloprotease [Proteobacteria bacterium]|nr:M48 family metalloprotease [Pseudomonadota bacterium]MBU1742052.1 M48 family metalloprotease [Pseudomonadota bacterium]